MRADGHSPVSPRTSLLTSHLLPDNYPLWLLSILAFWGGPSAPGHMTFHTLCNNNVLDALQAPDDKNEYHATSDLCSMCCMQLTWPSSNRLNPTRTDVSFFGRPDQVLYWLRRSLIPTQCQIPYGNATFRLWLRKSCLYFLPRGPIQDQYFTPS